MKTKHLILSLFTAVCIISCSDEIKHSYQLFDNSVRIQLSESFQVDSIKSNLFVNRETGISVLLLLSKDRKLGNIENISFDELYNSVSSDIVNITNKEIIETNGLKFGIKEITSEKADFVFFAEVNNELLYGKIEGKTEDEELVRKTGKELLRTVEFVGTR